MNHDSNALKPNLMQYKHLFNFLSKGRPTWVIGLYVRISKEEKKKNVVTKSIENQIKNLAFSLSGMDEEFNKSVPLDDFTIYDIYIDDGSSGTDFDREDYQRLQRDIENKIVNCFIVVDLSRYARNVKNSLQGLEDLVFKTKVRFIKASDYYIDTYTNPKAISSDEVMKEITTAEDHARTTSKKIRRMQAMKMRNGEPVGGFPPYGYLYDKDTKSYVPDPYASKIIKQIFIWKAEGYSNNKIAQMLNEQSILNPSAYKRDILKLNYINPNASENSGLWWPQTVSRILKDKTHTGTMVQGKTERFDHLRHKAIPMPEDKQHIIDNCHEENISQEIFDKVEQIRMQNTRVSKNTGKVHLFANLVYCSSCGIAMKKNNNGDYKYLTCRTYSELSKDKCTKRTVNYRVLESSVLTIIKHQIGLIADIQRIVEDINSRPVISNQSNRINTMLNSCKQEYSKIESIFDKSYFDYSDGIISQEQYQRIRKDTESKLVQLKDTIQKLSDDREKISQGIKSNNQYFDTFLKFKNIDSLDRDLLLELVHKIYINENKTIKLEFKFDDQYKLILDYIKENAPDEMEKIKTLNRKLD